jgi:hypothetical protein
MDGSGCGTQQRQADANGAALVGGAAMFSLTLKKGNSRQSKKKSNSG